MQWEVANVLNCDILVSEFEPQSSYNVQFRTNTLGKGMYPLIHPLQLKVKYLFNTFFYKNGFSIT